MENSGRRKSSRLWAHFHIVNNESRLAYCRHCDQLLSYKSTVSNLRKHLERRHRSVKIIRGPYTPPTSPPPTPPLEAAEIKAEQPEEHNNMEVDAVSIIEDGASIRSCLPIPIKKEAVVDETCLGSVVSCATSGISVSSVTTGISVSSVTSLVPSVYSPLPSEVTDSPSTSVQNLPTVIKPSNMSGTIESVKATNPQSKLTTIDESVFHDFGKCVGIYLTKLPLERALITKEKIHTMITQEYLSALRSSVESYSHAIPTSSYTLSTPDSSICESSTKSCCPNPLQEILP